MSEHWWCPACGTFDGPHHEEFCDVCADGTCIDGLVPRAEVERLRAKHDEYVQIANVKVRELEAKVEQLREDRDRILEQSDERWQKLDAALAARDEARTWRAEFERLADQRMAKIERLRGALEGIKARCDRIVAGEFGGLQAATEIANEARRALAFFEFVPRAWSRDTPDFERALAAAASDEDAEAMWELVNDELQLQLTGVFDNDWDTGDLLFAIRRAKASQPLRLRLLVYVASADEPVRSAVFEPKEGERVRFADTHVPSEVERLGAEVVT